MTFQATPVAPETFRTFQSFMTFQPFQAILHCSSISRESTPFQHSPIRIHILQFYNSTVRLVSTENSTEYKLNNYRHYIHSSKKGRCCDIGQFRRCQDDIFPRIELIPLSSCQVIILITIMSFNCFSSCLMSKVSIGITINTSKCYERAQQCNDNSQFSSHS